VVTSDPGKSVGKVAAFQEFLDDFGDNRSPEPILSFKTFIIYLHKLLKVISDALIKRALLRRARTIYAHLFCHFG
jgi:hypothetical protein